MGSLNSGLAMTIRFFDKDRYSEWVIRQSLYWLTPSTPWTLDEEGAHWVIRLKVDSFDAVAELDRLLNDFLLREKIGHQTDGVRGAIADAVLRSIKQRLAES